MLVLLTYFPEIEADIPHSWVGSGTEEEGANQRLSGCAMHIRLERELGEDL